MLKPETSLTVGLATGAMVYGIYNMSLASVLDVRDAPSGDPQVASTEKTAAWTSAAVVAGVSLIAKDPTVFILGGSMVVALAWWYRHANQVNPEWGVAVPKGDMLPEQFDDSTMAESEAYDESSQFAFA